MDQELTANLVRRSQAGDQEAAQELYARHADYLLGYIARRMSEKLARDASPEDILQSVYKSLFSAIGGGEYQSLGRGELKKILTGVARHKICARARKVTAREKAVGPPVPLGDPQSPEVTPEEAAEVYDATEKCLSEQDEDGRKIILMFFFEGRSVSAIAKALGISERTVRRTRSYFKQRLEHLLQVD